VPTVVGVRFEEAARALADKGLQVGRIEFRDGSGQPDGTVLRQSLAAGESVPRSAAIDLVIAKRTREGNLSVSPGGGTSEAVKKKPPPVPTK
jgi:beta-lactam-binding protein with PASTA domain